MYCTLSYSYSKYWFTVEISIFNFFTSKGYIAMLPGFIFLAVLLSQPLIFGGESRVAAPVILIINYIKWVVYLNLIKEW